MSRKRVIYRYVAMGPPLAGGTYFAATLLLGALIPPAYALDVAGLIMYPFFMMRFIIGVLLFSYALFLLQSAVHGVVASNSRSSDGLVRYWPVGLTGLLTGAVSMMLANRFFTPALDDSIAIGLGSFISSLLVTKLYNYDRSRGKI